MYEPDSFVPLAQAHNGGGWADQSQRLWVVDPGRQNRHQHLSEAAAADRIYFVSTDHLGTPQELVDEDGKIVWLAKYRAWGRINALDRAEVAQPLRFQGQYEDAETGLYYNRHRYDDPNAGRYRTKDPIGLFVRANNYHYAPSATQWVDALGLCKAVPEYDRRIRRRAVEDPVAIIFPSASTRKF